jgi:hypothetical protein
MSRTTYRGIWKNNQLIWVGARPQEAEDGAEVEVTFVKPEIPARPKPTPAEVLAAFERLAAAGTFADIEDPVAWQREVRKDRPLPGRD